MKLAAACLAMAAFFGCGQPNLSPPQESLASLRDRAREGVTVHNVGPAEDDIFAGDREGQFVYRVDIDGALEPDVLGVYVRASDDNVINEMPLRLYQGQNGGLYSEFIAQPSNQWLLAISVKSPTLGPISVWVSTGEERP